MSLIFLDVAKDGEARVHGLDEARGLAVGPDGRHVYATGFADDSLLTFLASNLGVFKADLPDAPFSIGSSSMTGAIRD